MKTKPIAAFVLALGLSAGMVHAQGQSQPAPLGSASSLHTGGLAITGLRGATLQPSASLPGSSFLLQKPPGAQPSAAPQPVSSPAYPANGGQNDEQLAAELRKLLDTEVAKQGGGQTAPPSQTLISLLREKGNRVASSEEIKSAMEMLKSLVQGSGENRQSQ